MRNIAFICAVAFVGAGCAKSSSSSQANIQSDARRYAQDGLTIDRPEGWRFVAPDASVAPDLLVTLLGPIGEAEMAPYFEVSRRALSAADQRRKPAHILLTLIREMVQDYAGFEPQGEPAEMEFAGQPAGSLDLRFTEMQGDGSEVSAKARVLGAVTQTDIWVFRLVVPDGGDLDETFTEIAEKVAFKG